MHDVESSMWSGSASCNRQLSTLVHTYICTWQYYVAIQLPNTIQLAKTKVIVRTFQGIYCAMMVSPVECKSEIPANHQPTRARSFSQPSPMIDAQCRYPCPPLYQCPIYPVLHLDILPRPSCLLHGCSNLDARPCRGRGCCWYVEVLANEERGKFRWKRGVVFDRRVPSPCRY